MFVGGDDSIFGAVAVVQSQGARRSPYTFFILRQENVVREKEEQVRNLV